MKKTLEYFFEDLINVRLPKLKLFTNIQKNLLTFFKKTLKFFKKKFI